MVLEHLLPLLRDWEYVSDATVEIRIRTDGSVSLHIFAEGMRPRTERFRELAQAGEWIRGQLRAG